MAQGDQAVQLRGRIASLRAAVADTRRGFADGEIIDLSALDDEAGAVCDAIAGLPEQPKGAAAGALAAALEGLLVELELLTDTVENGRAALSEWLAEVAPEPDGA